MPALLIRVLFRRHGRPTIPYLILASCVVCPSILSTECLSSLDPPEHFRPFSRPSPFPRLGFGLFISGVSAIAARLFITITRAIESTVASSLRQCRVVVRFHTPEHSSTRSTSAEFDQVSIAAERATSRSRVLHYTDRMPTSCHRRPTITSRSKETKLHNELQG